MTAGQGKQLFDNEVYNAPSSPPNSQCPAAASFIYVNSSYFFNLQAVIHMPYTIHLAKLEWFVQTFKITIFVASLFYCSLFVQL